MSIATYSELKTAIASWRSRVDLTSQLSDFVTVAESRINRKLRTRWQETALASTAIDSSYQVAVPAGCVGIKSLWLDRSPTWRLHQKTLENVLENQFGGDASMFAWSGSNWLFDGVGSVKGVYYVAVPSLSDSSPTNWLLTAYPDVYLWASLEQACIYLRDIEGATGYASLANNAMDELNSNSQADQVSGGKLIASWR